MKKPDKLISMSSITCLQKLTNKRQKRIDGDSDEYYTPIEMVETIFKNIRPEYIKDKIIYCPCDSDESKFVIYLKENKERLGYKELIYTSDDFNNHIDLFLRSDLVVTNPPFSKNSQFYRLMQELNVNFVVISISSSAAYVWKYGFSLIRFEIGKLVHFENKKFKAKEHTIDCVCSSEDLVIRQYDEKPRYYRLVSEIEDQLEYFDNYRFNDQKVLNVNYIYDLPLDYDGYFGLPGTFVRANSPIIKNIEILEVVKDTTVNGKKKFIRLCCKWKDINENNKYIN